MTIPQAEEEKYRRAARDINSLIAAYKTRFMAEPEDYLAMAALQVAADKVDLEMKGEMTDQAVRLQEIERRIDGYLNDIKEKLRVLTDNRARGSLHTPRKQNPHGFLLSFAKLNTIIDWGQAR